MGRYFPGKASYRMGLADGGITEIRCEISGALLVATGERKKRLPAKRIHVFIPKTVSPRTWIVIFNSGALCTQPCIAFVLFVCLCSSSRKWLMVSFSVRVEYDGVNAIA